MRTVRRVAATVGVAAVSAFGAAAPALAQAYPGGVTEERTPPAVLSNEEQRSPDVANVAQVQPAAQVQASDQARQPQVLGATFAVTGGDVVGLSLLGGGLIVGGVLVMRRTRRTAAVAAG